MTSSPRRTTNLKPHREVDMRRPVPHRRAPLRLVCLAAALVALAASPWVASQAPAEKGGQPARSGRLPVPDRAALETAQKLVERVFAEDLALAQKEPAAAVSLAGTLLSEARQVQDDPPLRYAALLLARDAAGQGGAINVALQAVEELVRNYKVKGLPLKAAGLAAAAKNASGKFANEAVAEAALSLIDEALFEDEFQIAQELADAAAAAAARTKVLKLVARVSRRVQDVEAARKEHDRIKPFLERVAKAEAGGKADPEASFQLGWYKCLIKGNWEDGLPLLAKGNNATWRAFAQSQLQRPDPPVQQAKLGDACLEMAEKEKGAAQQSLQRRALYWYDQALPKLKGLTRARVEREVVELARVLPPALLSSGGGGTAEITAELRNFPSTHLAGVYVSRVSADGKTVITGGQNDKFVRLLDAQSGKEVRTLLGHFGNQINCVALSPDGKYAASGDTNKELRVWDAASGGLYRQFVGHTDWVRGVHFMPDGKTLLSVSDDKTLRTWSLQNGNQLTSFNIHTKYVNGLSVSRDSTRAATCSEDFTVAVWDLKTMQEIRRFKHNSQVWGVAISPDGRRVVSAGQGLDRTVRVWDVGSGQELRKLPLPPTSVGFCAAFSPDGRRVYVGCGFSNPPGGFKGMPLDNAENCVRVFDVETGKEVRRLTGPNGFVRSVSLTADGRLLVSSGNDNTIRVWGEKK
jgi:DNA-binding beta-propeller fold protein YncE